MNNHITFSSTTATAANGDEYKKLLSLTDAEFVKLLNVGHPGGTTSLLQSNPPAPIQRPCD